MRDIAEELRGWLSSGEPIVLAIVVDVRGSAPRPLGTMMAVTHSGAVLGNVSAGCVESAVVDQAQRVLAGAGKSGVATFGIADETAHAVGLMCGGTVSVLIFALAPADRPTLQQALDLDERGEPFHLCCLAAGPGRLGSLRVVTAQDAFGSLGNPGIDGRIADAARRAAPTQEAVRWQQSHLGGDTEILIQPFRPRPDMLLFGAIDIAVPLTRVGRLLGYRVTVCDAREAFVTTRRFPDADAVVVQWPHRFLAAAEVDERTVICALTHDPKVDVPLLCAALRTPAGYIGVMGSRSTQDDRLRRLRAEGVDDAALARLHAPIGLQLGGRTAAETALSIGAEIVAVRSGGTGLPLRLTAGPIHAAST